MTFTSNCARDLYENWKSGCIRIRILISGDYLWNFCAPRGWWWTRACTPRKWTRDRAIDYLKQNTPNSEGECVDAINRYIVMPSQATAYKIGMLKILELREKAKRALGAKFDIRQFHDVLLTNGALPVDVLEDLVNRWIKSKQP